MTRLTVLLSVLSILAAVMIPYSVMDQMITQSRGATERARQEATPLARQARDLMAREATVAAHRQRLKALDGRLLATEPFAVMRSELNGAALAAGLGISGLALEALGPVPDLPELVRYQAAFQVKGGVAEYLQFLRSLEEHRLLIEVPEVTLKPQPQPQASGPEVNLGMSVWFYGRATR